MFDDKKYLTGDNGEFKEGDEFTLVAARIAGTVKVNGQDRTEAKLTILDANGDELTVYTSGRGIVGAIERIDSNDLPARVKLSSKETRNGKMFQLVKQGEAWDSQPPPLTQPATS
jgi:hypothetical protein